MSRNPVLEPHENEDEQLQIVNLIKLEEILSDQTINQNIKKENMIKKNGIYYKKIKNKEKIVLTEKFSLQIVQRIHKHYCHIGIEQMRRKISPYYTGKNLISNIKTVCKNCTVCIKNKSRGQDKFGLMSHFGPAKNPFEIMSIDTIGGFGGSRSTKKYLHLLMDHFTRFAWILTSKTQSANDFIKLVKRVSNNNELGIILSDQYPGINSKEFKNYLDEIKVPIVFTAVNSPFSNGLNERSNQTLVNKIRCKINEIDNKVAWSTIAHECTKRYNETEHTVTGFRPIYLLEGEDTQIVPNELRNRNMQNDLVHDREKALENTVKSHNYNKKLFDKKRKEFFSILEIWFLLKMGIK